MSYSSTPSDHTVADRPWYLWKRIHSGGLYTLVPVKKMGDREEKEGGWADDESVFCGFSQNHENTKGISHRNEGSSKEVT